MSETLKCVYFLHLRMHLSAALMERFLTWVHHYRNSSQAGDDNQGSKVLQFGSISTSHPRDFLIKKLPLRHFRVFFKQLKKFLNFPHSPVHFVVLQHQLSKSRSFASFPLETVPEISLCTFPQDY